MRSYERVSEQDSANTIWNIIEIWAERIKRSALFVGSVLCNVFSQGVGTEFIAGIYALMMFFFSVKDILIFIGDRNELRLRDKVSLLLSGVLSLVGIIGYIVFTLKDPELSGLAKGFITAGINLVAVVPTAIIPQLTNCSLDRHSGHYVPAYAPRSSEREDEQEAEIAELNLESTYQENPLAVQRSVLTRQPITILDEAKKGEARLNTTARVPAEATVMSPQTSSIRFFGNRAPQQSHTEPSARIQQYK